MAFACIGAYSKHPNIKKKRYVKKKRGGTEEEERKASFFFCHSPCGDSHPGEVTHLRPEPKETADVRNKHSPSGCVQSFNHLHFQLKKKKKREFSRRILSLAHWVKSVLFFIFHFYFLSCLVLFMVFFFFFFFLNIGLGLLKACLYIMQIVHD